MFVAAQNQEMGTFFNGWKINLEWKMLRQSDLTGGGGLVAKSFNWLYRGLIFFCSG